MRLRDAALADMYERVSARVHETVGSNAVNTFGKAVGEMFELRGGRHPEAEVYAT